MDDVRRKERKKERMKCSCNRGRKRVKKGQRKDKVRMKMFDELE